MSNHSEKIMNKEKLPFKKTKNEKFYHFVSLSFYFLYFGVSFNYPKITVYEDHFSQAFELK